MGSIEKKVGGEGAKIADGALAAYREGRYDTALIRFVRAAQTESMRRTAIRHIRNARGIADEMAERRIVADGRALVDLGFTELMLRDSQLVKTLRTAEEEIVESKRRPYHLRIKPTNTFNKKVINFIRTAEKSLKSGDYAKAGDIMISLQRAAYKKGRVQLHKEISDIVVDMEEEVAEACERDDPGSARGHYFYAATIAEMVLNDKIRADSLNARADAIGYR